MTADNAEKEPDGYADSFRILGRRIGILSILGSTCQTFCELSSVSYNAGCAWNKGDRPPALRQGKKEVWSAILLPQLEKVNSPFHKTVRKGFQFICGIF